MESYDTTENISSDKKAIQYVDEYLNECGDRIFKDFNIIDAILFQHHHIHHEKDENFIYKDEHKTHHCPIMKIAPYLSGKGAGDITMDELPIEHCKCGKHHVISTQYGICITSNSFMKPVVLLFKFMETCPYTMEGYKAYHIESGKVIKVFDAINSKQEAAK